MSDLQKSKKLINLYALMYENDNNQEDIEDIDRIILQQKRMLILKELDKYGKLDIFLDKLSDEVINAITEPYQELRKESFERFDQMTDEEFLEHEIKVLEAAKNNTSDDPITDITHFYITNAINGDEFDKVISEDRDFIDIVKDLDYEIEQEYDNIRKSYDSVVDYLKEDDPENAEIYEKNKQKFIEEDPSLLKGMATSSLFSKVFRNGEQVNHESQFLRMSTAIKDTLLSDDPKVKIGLKSLMLISTCAASMAFPPTSVLAVAGIAKEMLRLPAFKGVNDSLEVFKDNFKEKLESLHVVKFAKENPTMFALTTALGAVGAVTTAYFIDPNFNSLVNKLIENKDVLSNIDFSSIKDFASNMVNATQENFQSVNHYISGVVDKMPSINMESVGQFTVNTVESLKNVFSIEQYKDVMANIKLPSLNVPSVDGMLSQVTESTTQVKSFFSNSISSFTDSLKGLSFPSIPSLSDTQELLTGKAMNIAQFFRDTNNDVISFVSNIGHNSAEFISQSSSTVIDTAKDYSEMIVDKISDTTNSIVDQYATMMSGKPEIDTLTSINIDQLESVSNTVSHELFANNPTAELSDTLTNTIEIQKNANLTSISRDLLGDSATPESIENMINKIVEINGIEDRNLIYAGADLKVPNVDSMNLDKLKELTEKTVTELDKTSIREFSP